MKIYIITKEWWVSGLEQTWSRVVAAHRNPPDLVALYGHKINNEEEENNGGVDYYVTEIELKD